MPKRLMKVPEYRVRATPLARLSIQAAGYYALIQGLVILIANPVRFTGPSYNLLMQVPGSPWSWGTSAFVFGVLILYGSYGRHWRAKALGLWCLSSWAFLFGAGALGAVYLLPNAGTTGPPTYALIGVWTVLLVWVDEGDASDDAQVKNRPMG